MKRILALGAGLAGAWMALATPGLAQEGLPPPSPPPGTDGGSAPPAEAATPAEQSDRLRRALSLSPAQEGALQAFVAAMAPRPGEADPPRRESGRHGPMTTPERLDRLLARMDQVRARLSDRVAATKTFYAQLTADQQRAFDAMPAQRGDPRRGAGGGRRGGRSGADTDGDPGN